LNHPGIDDNHDRDEEGELKQLLLKLQKQTLGHKIVLKILHVYAE